MLLITEKTIARRDELLKKKVGGASRTAKLSNEIRQMIRFIQKDRDRLAAILEKNKKPKVKHCVCCFIDF